jgi:hypothetical protein
MLNMDDKLTILLRRSDALARYSPDGGMPEHEHHIERKGMGGRPTSLATLPTIGVSARLHQLIHSQGDDALNSLPPRRSLADLW